MAVIVVLVLALGGGGAFWFMKNGGNPKDSAQKFVEAQIAGNYRAQYDLMVLGAETKKQVPNADAYEKQMKSGPAEQVRSMLSEVKLVSVGESKIDGDTAKVPVEISFKLQGQTQTMKQDVPMKKVDGKWKVDLDPNAVNKAVQGTKKGP
jgi:hypothetical protein